MWAVARVPAAEGAREDQKHHQVVFLARVGEEEEEEEVLVLAPEEKVNLWAAVSLPVIFLRLDQELVAVAPAEADCGGVALEV